jgi:uncharacterized membrane-anchored protein YhcB (DUF1043 family)
MARFSKTLEKKGASRKIPSRKRGKKSGRKGKPRKTRLRLTRTLRKKSRRNVYTGGGLQKLPMKPIIIDDNGTPHSITYVELSDPESEELAEYRTTVEPYFSANIEFKKLEQKLTSIYQKLDTELSQTESNLSKEEKNEKKKKFEERLKGGARRGQGQGQDPDPAQGLSGQLLRDLIGARSAFHHHLELPPSPPRKGTVSDVNKYAIDRLFRKRYKVTSTDDLDLPESHVFKLFNRENDFEVFYLKKVSSSKRVKTYKNAFEKMIMQENDVKQKFVQTVTKVDDTSTPGVIAGQLLNKSILTKFITQTTGPGLNPTDYDIYIVENKDISGNTISDDGQPVPIYSVGDITSVQLNEILEPLYSKGLVFSQIHITDIYTSTTTSEILFCPDFWYSVTKDNITETIFYVNLESIQKEIKTKFPSNHRNTPLEITFFNDVLEQFLRVEDKLFDLAYIFSYITIYKNLRDLRPRDESTLDFESFILLTPFNQLISSIVVNVVKFIQTILEKGPYSTLKTKPLENLKKITAFMNTERKHHNIFYMVSYFIKLLRYTIDVT